MRDQSGFLRDLRDGIEEIFGVRDGGSSSDTLGRASYENGAAWRDGRSLGAHRVDERVGVAMDSRGEIHTGILNRLVGRLGHVERFLTSYPGKSTELLRR